VIARSKLHILITILKALGLYRGLSYIIRAKVLKQHWADAALGIALHGEHPPVMLKPGLVLWRNRVFNVPPELLNEFFTIVAELVFVKAYKFDSIHDVIIDVGGFLGETAWWFLTEGSAKRVVVFEPVYYELCVKNVGDVAEVYPYAIHPTQGKVLIKIAGAESRVYDKGETKVTAMPLARVLSRFSGSVAVKIDCEGCEESLLHTPCDLIRRADEYIVEIHPNVDMNGILSYMKGCGFEYKPKIIYRRGLAIYHFSRMCSQ